MSIRKFAEYANLSHRTLESYKSSGYLPPHSVVTARRHLFNKPDIDAWLELKRRGLLGDYQDLRDRLGALDAWAVMLARLVAAEADTLAVVAREVTL